MNVTPVSFGRVIKVNAPLEVAQHAAKLANSEQVYYNAEENAQEQLKDFFYDNSEGDVQAVSLDYNDKESYLVSGVHSVDVSILNQDRNKAIAAARKQYGEGSTLEIKKEAEQDRYIDLLKMVLDDAEEGMALDIDYSTERQQIKSINFII